MTSGSYGESVSLNNPSDVQKLEDLAPSNKAQKILSVSGFPTDPKRLDNFQESYGYFSEAMS